MKSLAQYLLLTLTLATYHTAQAGPSMLRVMCDGEDIGAEVSINSKFKGECPIDIQVAPGTAKLRVFKKVNASNERILEQEVCIGDGVVKKIEAVLTNRLTEEGKRLEPERLRQATEKFEIEKQASQKKIDECYAPYRKKVDAAVDRIDESPYDKYNQPEKLTPLWRRKEQAEKEAADARIECQQRYELKKPTR